MTIGTTQALPKCGSGNYDGVAGTRMASEITKALNYYQHRHTRHRSAFRALAAIRPVSSFRSMPALPQPVPGRRLRWSSAVRRVLPPGIVGNRQISPVAVSAKRRISSASRASQPCSAAIRFSPASTDTTAARKAGVARMIAFSASTARKKATPPMSSQGHTHSGTDSLPNIAWKGGA